MTKDDDELSGVRVQQASEKRLKARSALPGDTNPLSHRHVEHAKRGRISFDAPVDDARFAVRPRHPDSAAGKKSLGRGEAIGQVNALSEEVRRRLMCMNRIWRVRAPVSQLRQLTNCFAER